MAKPDDACKHDDWRATATLYRDRETEDGPVTSWSVVVEATCETCLTPMVWETAGPVEPGKVAVAIRLPCHPFAVQAREIGEVSS